MDDLARFIAFLKDLENDLIRDMEVSGGGLKGSSGTWRIPPSGFLLIPHPPRNPFAQLGEFVGNLDTPDNPFALLRAADADIRTLSLQIAAKRVGGEPIEPIVIEIPVIRTAPSEISPTQPITETTDETHPNTPALKRRLRTECRERYTKKGERHPRSADNPKESATGWLQALRPFIESLWAPYSPPPDKTLTNILSELLQQLQNAQKS